MTVAAPVEGISWSVGAETGCSWMVDLDIVDTNEGFDVYPVLVSIDSGLGHDLVLVSVVVTLTLLFLPRLFLHCNTNHFNSASVLLNYVK